MLHAMWGPGSGLAVSKPSQRPLLLQEPQGTKETPASYPDPPSVDLIHRNSSCDKSEGARAQGNKAKSSKLATSSHSGRLLCEKRSISY